MTLEKATKAEDSTDTKSDKSEEEKKEDEVDEKKQEEKKDGKLMKSEEDLEKPVARWSTLNTAIKYVGGYRIVILVFIIQTLQTVFQQVIE